MRIRHATTSSSSSSASRALLFLLVLVLAGCGGDDNPEAQQECIAETRSAAEADVVATFFQAGRIGTREEVERDLDHPSLRFFDDQGQLLSYEDMTAAARAAFNRWLVTSRAGDITFDARQEARDMADTSHCDE
jgi:hypothetical protein